MQPRFLAIAAVALAVLISPAAANAASLSVVNQKPCFGAGDRIDLSGSGWQPGASISFTRDNTALRGSVVANAAGKFLTSAVAPRIRAKRHAAAYSATDGVSGVAAAPVRLSRLGVSIRPRRASPDEARQISARGFTFDGRRTLYSHRVRDGRSRNATVGRLSGACKTASRRKPILRGAAPGTYRLQFDTYRRYRAERRQRVVFRVRVVGSEAAAAAGAAAFGAQTTTASWERLR